MSLWNTNKTPSSFPIILHQPFTNGPGRYVIETGAQAECKKMWRKFHALKAALKRNPNHPSARLLGELQFRAHLTEYCGVTDWACEVVVTRRVDVTALAKAAGLGSISEIA